MSRQDLAIIGFQIILPLALLAWLALAPAESLLGYGVQVIATGIALLALCLVPIWSSWATSGRARQVAGRAIRAFIRFLESRSMRLAQRPVT